MQYVVKNEQNELVRMTVISGVPTLPEGFELIGLESEINPNNVDLSIGSAQMIEIVAAKQILISEEIPAISEVLDENGNVITPAVAAIPAVWETIPAVLGLRIVEDASKVSIARQAKANAYLEAIRTLRAPLLDAADKEINKAEDDGIDTTALRAYRKELRACTDVLKKVNGDAKLSCETLIASEFVFPTKP